MDKYKLRLRNSFRLKVLFSIMFSILVFSIVSNLIISTLLGYQLFKKREEIEKGYMNVVYAYLEEMEENMEMLALLAENSSEVRWLMKNKSMSTMEEKKYALAAQKNLLAILNANPVNQYVDRMLVFNRSGIVISVTDAENLIYLSDIYKSPIFEKDVSDGKARVEVTTSMLNEKEKKLVYLYPLDNKENSYIYLEVSTDAFLSLLEPYKDSANIMIGSLKDTNSRWYSSEWFRQDYEELKKAGTYYELRREFMPFSLYIQTMTEKNIYSADNSYILYTFLILMITVIGVGMIVSRLISTKITQPLSRLSEHIAGLANEEELTVNSAIEEGEDEISEIGKTFNRLVLHMNDLIDRQKEVYEQKKRLEMNALQAQINPHFLYNTLDSIRWMAVIQKANNIAGTVMSLENLLRNMAKSVGDKITLREELSLVQDYVNLQQVRYMEIFDYICEIPEEYMDCRIVKLTMQPIIENAIIHGIEPTGTYGEIRVSVKEDQGELYISIEDNGVGMNKQELMSVLSMKKSKNAMSGIGVANVDERLKMTYGSQYGLIYEGEKGCFTRVTIHIPKER